MWFTTTRIGRGHYGQRKAGQVVTTVMFHYAKLVVVSRIGTPKRARLGSDCVRLMDLGQNLSLQVMFNAYNEAFQPFWEFGYMPRMPRR